MTSTFDPYMCSEERTIKKIVLEDSSFFQVGSNSVEEIEPYDEGDDRGCIWFVVMYPYNGIKKVNGRFVVLVEYE